LIDFNETLVRGKLRVAREIVGDIAWVVEVLADKGKQTIEIAIRSIRPVPHSPQGSKTSTPTRVEIGQVLTLLPIPTANDNGIENAAALSEARLDVTFL